MKSIDVGLISCIAPYGDAVVGNGASRWLMTSGMPGFDSNSTIPADFSTQATNAWNNVITTLQAADMSVQNIVRVMHFLVRRQDLPTYRLICKAMLGNTRPASTLVFVAELPWPEMLIEIQIDAVKD